MSTESGEVQLARTVTSVMKSFLALRLATALCTFIVAAVGSALLGPVEYGSLGAFGVTAKAMLALGLGANSGYIATTYSRTEPPLPEASFLRCYRLHLMLMGAVGGAVLLWLDPRSLSGVLGFGCLIVWFVREPIARVKGEYWVSLVPEWILGAVAIAYVMARVLFPDLDHSSAGWMLLLAVGGSTLLSVGVLRPRDMEWPRGSRPCRADWRRFVGTIVVGFPLAASTLVYSILLLTGVLVVQARSPTQELGVYTLAMQCAVGASLIQSTSNFVGAMELGAGFKAGCKLVPMLRARVVRGVIAAVCCVGLAAGGAGVLETWILPEYVGLSKAVLILAFGMTAFQVAGAASPILFYSRRQRAPLAILLIGSAAWVPLAWSISAGSGGAARVAGSVSALLVLQAATCLTLAIRQARCLDAEAIRAQC